MDLLFKPSGHQTSWASISTQISVWHVIPSKILQSPLSAAGKWGKLSFSLKTDPHSITDSFYSGKKEKKKANVN